jgi:hypothetical protein
VLLWLELVGENIQSGGQQRDQRPGGDKEAKEARHLRLALEKASDEEAVRKLV